MAKADVIVVTGPTASGKSALALALAERRGGTVINADAMQTYDAFPILTAQPTAEERAQAPHRLYGALPLSETLSAARWRTLAEAEIAQCRQERRRAILCGGSGLYLRALMQGFSAIPSVPAEACDTAHSEWEAMGAAACRARLAERDPAIVAKLKPGDRQRHVRAWEVLITSGRPLSQWQTGEGKPAPWRFTTILLTPQRTWLRDRIAVRFDAMLQGGVLAEVRAVSIASQAPMAGQRPWRTGVVSPFPWRVGARSARQIAIDTRQYAKRQTAGFGTRWHSQWRTTSIKFWGERRNFWTNEV